MFSTKPLPRAVIDLNADVGEGNGRALIDVDPALIPQVTSINIACGMHAGDPVTMSQTVSIARRHGVRVGAHPSYLDRDGFGRRELDVSPDEVESLVLYQVGALWAIAAAQAVALQHVKPHGALYNVAARVPDVADALARAVRSVDRRLLLFGLAGSELIAAGERAGLQTVSEVFADRAYRPDGSLVPRGEPGAVLHDPDAIASQAVALATAPDLRAETICIHGDTPGAPMLASRIRTALEQAGLVVRAVGDRS